MTLNQSTVFLGEPIAGSFEVTVDSGTVPPIDILNASLEFILKDDPYKPDEDALAFLTVGDGLTVVQNTSSLYEVLYAIPGTATMDVKPQSSLQPREGSRTLFYEVNVTFDNETESTVLESGVITLRLDRVKTF